MRIVAFLLFLFSGSVFSADYYWIQSNYNVVGASPSIVCNGVVSKQKSGGYPNARFGSVTRISDILFTCQYFLYATGSSNETLNISRNGDSCPSGTLFDSVTGVCSNPCASKAGTSERLSRSGTLGDGVLNKSGKMTLRGSNFATGCMGGCMADTSSFRCTGNLTKNTYVCRGSAVYSGQTCAATGTIDPTSTSLPDPDPQTLKDQQPCVYVTDSSGKQSCVSKNITETEAQQCGTFNGKEICPPKAPSKNGVTIATDVTTTSNSDGSSTIVKTDTATTIKCDGFDSCVTQVTKITTTTGKSSNGTSTGSSSSCTGAFCAGSNTSPDANGDGLGDCVDGSCSDGSGGDGDGSSGAKTPDLEDVPGFADTTNSFVNRLQNSPIASTAMALRAPSGACYKPSVDLSAIHLGTVTYSGHCDVLEQNRSLISLLAKTLWALAAFWIFLG